MRLDYVNRRFNASPARLNKPLGLDLRWDTAQRDLRFQMAPGVKPKRGQAILDGPREDASWFRAELDCSSTEKASVQNFERG
jgi:hypothetical protein